MKRTIFQRIQIWFVELIAKVHWRQKHRLSGENKEKLRSLLSDGYYIIATRRDNQLSTWLISLGHSLLTGRRGYYSHVLMNLEDKVTAEDDFRFIEATSHGVSFSDFKSVFDSTYAVALIAPKSMTIEQWTVVLDRAKTYIGRPYDNLFDLKNDLEINCVELVRLALQAEPTNYTTNFAAFEKLVNKKGKLTPQMFIDCSDFEVKYSFKR